MVIEYDEAKNAKNTNERQLPFDLVRQLGWDTAAIDEDTRHEYPERRLIVVAYLNERLHVACVTPIVDGFRVISFRKANKREVKNYEKRTKSTD